jgi:glucan biosynthesis protein C
MNRRHDIDALRALAFALVILYHVGMYYVAGWHWHMKSPHAAEWLQMPMRALNLWRMDLVFLVSGLALGFVRRKGGPLRLLGQRSARLLLPLAFGMAVVVPFQPYAQMLAKGLIQPGFVDFLPRYFAGGPWPAGAFDGSEFGVTWNHLWYLAYLWLYTAVLILCLPLLESRPGLQLRQRFVRLRGMALVVLPLLPLALATAWLLPRFPVTHAMVGDWWLHATSFLLFLYGYWIGVDAGWWAEAMRLRRPLSLTAALALLLHFVLRAGGPGLAPALAAEVYTWTIILAVLGWSHRYLNRPWPWLAWSRQAVYPWYVLHQTVIIVAVFWLAPLALGPVIEPVLLVLATVAGCWGVTAMVQRVGWLRPLFGLPRRHEKSLQSRPLPRSAGGVT